MSFQAIQQPFLRNGPRSLLPSQFDISIPTPPPTPQHNSVMNRQQPDAELPHSPPPPPFVPAHSPVHMQVASSIATPQPPASRQPHSACSSLSSISPPSNRRPRSRSRFHGPVAQALHLQFGNDSEDEDDDAGQNIIMHSAEHMTTPSQLPLASHVTPADVQRAQLISDCNESQIIESGSAYDEEELINQQVGHNATPILRAVNSNEPAEPAAQAHANRHSHRQFVLTRKIRRYIIHQWKRRLLLPSRKEPHNQRSRQQWSTAAGFTSTPTFHVDGRSSISEQYVCTEFEDKSHTVRC